MASYHIAFAEAADRDIVDVIARSKKNFGTAASNRYQALLTRALLDLASDPHRPGAKARPEIGGQIYTYHLAASRPTRSRTGVKTPRHFIVYSFAEQTIMILRVLHDRSDLRRHID